MSSTTTTPDDAIRRNNIRNLNGKRAVITGGINEYVPQRYGSILRPAEVGEHVAEPFGDPRYLQGVAYGSRDNCDIQPLDI